MGVSDFRRFGAARRAVWPVGRAGTARPLGLDWGPELTLTGGRSSRLVVPTYDVRCFPVRPTEMRNCLR
eukprot:14134680-Alexandrium_andersonii.AAC.1